MCKRVLVVPKRHREGGGQLLKLLALSQTFGKPCNLMSTHRVLSDTGEDLLSLLRDKMKTA